LTITIENVAWPFGRAVPVSHDGTFHLAGLPTGTYRLCARSACVPPTYSAPFDVAPATTAGTVTRLAPWRLGNPRRVSIAVAGAEQPEARVQITSAETGALLAEQGLQRSLAEFELLPGRYRARAFGQRAISAETEFDVAAASDPTDVTLVMAAATPLTLRVRAPALGSPLPHASHLQASIFADTPRALWSGRAQANANDEACWSVALPPGRYRVWVHGSCGRRVDASIVVEAAPLSQVLTLQ
jgi:hypothetical protein